MESNREAHKGVSRRDFLRKVGGAAAGATFAGLASSTYSLASPRAQGANDRLRAAVIGVGGMGGAHLGKLVEYMNNGPENIEVVAVCDVYQPRLEAAVARTEGKAQGYRDYRQVLERPDVQVVWVAVPDHWHSKITIEAMQAGKDVYCEKPLAHTFDQAKQVRRTMQETGRVLQVGTQWLTEDSWYQANEMIKEGKIGKVVWSQGSYCRNSMDGEWNYGIDPNARPGENLDWDMWLGHQWGLAPKIDWNPEHYFRWRKFWAYSGGIATDLFPHVLCRLMAALGPEFPTRVNANGGVFVHHDREVPDTFHFMADFPSGHTVLMVGSTANEQGLPSVIRGHQGTLYISGDRVELRPERPYADEVEPETEQVAPPVDHLQEHHHDFLEAVANRSMPRGNAEISYRWQTVISLSVSSYREQKTKLFDPEKEEIVA